LYTYIQADRAYFYTLNPLCKTLTKHVLQCADLQMWHIGPYFEVSDALLWVSLQNITQHVCELQWDFVAFWAVLVIPPVETLGSDAEKMYRTRRRKNFSECIGP